MKKKLLFIIILLIKNYSFAQNNPKKPYLVKEYGASVINYFKLNSSGGTISIEGSSDSLARVEVYLRPSFDNGKMSNDETENLMKNYELMFTLKEGKLQYDVKRLKNVSLKKSLSIIFKIKLPKNTAIDINSGGGNINLTNINGSINLNSSGGGLILENISGSIIGYTSGGVIAVKSCNGKYDLTTMSGNINLSASEGDIKLKNSKGKITIENVTGNIEANTKKGEINGKNIKGTLNVNTDEGPINLNEIIGIVNARTLNGDIYANIPSIKNSLNLATSSGNIKLDMPINKGLHFDFRAQKITHEKLNNFTGTAEDKYINGKIFDGGITVKLQADSGNIKLN